MACSACVSSGDANAPDCAWCCFCKVAPDSAGLQIKDGCYRSVRYSLMHFDDVALWVMEEHLMPLLGEGSPIV